MDLLNANKLSQKMKLVELVPELMEFETLPADGEEEKFAWVIVSMADESDVRRVAEIAQAKESRLLTPDGSNLIMAEIIKPDDRQVAAERVYLTLHDAGNLDIDKKPIFPIYPVREMEPIAFLSIWNSLPGSLTLAIDLAVIHFNRFWLRV
jgi:hypothetical protein